MTHVVALLPDLLCGSTVRPAHRRADAQARADAGFHLVVPRSRMAREGAALVDGLLAPAQA